MLGVKNLLRISYGDKRPPVTCTAFRLPACSPLKNSVKCLPARRGCGHFDFPAGKFCKVQHFGLFQIIIFSWARCCFFFFFNAIYGKHWPYDDPGELAVWGQWRWEIMDQILNLWGCRWGCPGYPGDHNLGVEGQKWGWSSSNTELANLEFVLRKNTRGVHWGFLGEFFKRKPVNWLLSEDFYKLTFYF